MNATIIVQPSADYQSLETLGSISFVKDTVYTIQVMQGSVKILESDTQPTAHGIHVHDDKPFNLISKGDDVYVKNLDSVSAAIIEIAD